MMGNWNYGGCGFGLGGWTGSAFFGWIFMIVFWVLIIWAIVAFVHAMTNRDEKMSQKDSALNILEERFAKGELSREEFEEKKRILGK